MADGLAGALVVRRAPAREPHLALYDEDRSEHVIIVSEWTHSFALQRLLQADKGSVAADALLINGRGASAVRINLHIMILQLLTNFINYYLRLKIISNHKICVFLIIYYASIL